MSVKDNVASFLTRELKKDSLYKLSFYLGFGTPKAVSATDEHPAQSPSPFNVIIYGFADSTLLPLPNPYGMNNSSSGAFGCLEDADKRWISLGTRLVYPSSVTQGNWVKDSISFIAPENIQVLAIGPACNSHLLLQNAPAYGNYYHFLDNLQLYQASSPAAIIEITDGSLCDITNASITLHLKSETYYRGSKLQWYKNNAPINETAGSLTITKTKYGEGWYQCGVQNDSVCIRCDSFHVAWEPFPGTVIGKNPDTTACNGDTVLLQVNGGTNGSYRWNDSSILPTKKITQGGTYSVSISNSCATVTATKTVNFKDCPVTVYVPTGFSPNGDGLNDVFKAVSFGNNGKLKSFKLSVYNRSGKKIFYSENILKGWDGTINRIPQNQGTFVWVVEYTDANDKPYLQKGTVALIK